MNERILFIDDDVEFQELLETLLSREGYKVFRASNGPDGLHLAYEHHPDLIILDVSMPGQNGFEVCRNLREITNVPILMLTARSAAADVNHGFTVGADDYIKKPFSNDELLLRVKALLRRGKNSNTNNKNSNITHYSDEFLKIDLIGHSCSVNGNPVSLTATEFSLLAILVQHPNQILSIHTLLSEVWGDGYSHDKGILSLYVHQLRQKLQDDNEEHKYIQTQWGRGYSFNPLPKAEKSIIAHNFDERVSDKAKPAKPQINRWVWISLIILVLILALRTESISGIFSGSAKGSTTLETLITAEGFIKDGVTGVHGQICITNTGKYPTENLSIVNSVQMIGHQQETYNSTTVNLDQKSVLAPSESNCYPYNVTFDALPEQDAKYKSLVNVTITNYFDMMPGSEHCPGADPCSFGPTAITDFNIPAP